MSDYKRLTERDENGQPYFDGCLHCDLESDCGLCPYWESGLNRLVIPMWNVANMQIMRIVIATA